MTLFACLALSLPLIASAQTGSPVSLESRLDKSSITIGDTVRYAVSLSRDSEVQVRWPGLAANLGAFEIRDYNQAEPRSENARVLEQVSYTISTFDTGRFVIPQLEIQYLVPPDTVWHALRSEQLDLYVESVRPSEAGDIRDIKVPWELPRDWRRIILLGSIATGVLLLALAGYVYWRRRQGKGLLPLRAAPPRLAHEIAFEALHKLRASDLIARGEIKAFYIELSEIVRRYIEDRYHVPALEETTSELLEQCDEMHLDDETIDMLTSLLEQSDLVKFAKFVPPAASHEPLLNLAEAFVEKTKEAPIIVATDGKVQTAVPAETKVEAVPAATEVS